MIKVIHVISDTNIGGAGTLLINYLKNFDREKFEIKVAVPKGSALIPRIKDVGYEVIETDGGRDKSFDVWAIGEFVRIFRREKPDIVHTHSSFSAKLAALLTGVKSRIYTRHCVFTMPWYLTHFPGKQINGLVNNTLATKIIAVAEAAKDNLTETGVSEKKISVIINGVEPIRAMSDEEKLAFREKLGLAKEDFVCLISARLEAVKGHKYFLDAAAIVAAEDEHAKFIVMGGGSLEQELRARALKHGLEDKVIFTGFVSDVTPYVNVMDLNVNCSYGTETSSLALSEGFSLSKPAVATIYGGNPYMVADGENGLLVPIKDAPKLADAIIRIKDDRELYDKMSEAAYKRYTEKFTAAHMTRQLEAIYEEDVKRRKRK